MGLNRYRSNSHCSEAFIVYMCREWHSEFVRRVSLRQEIESIEHDIEREKFSSKLFPFQILEWIGILVLLLCACHVRVVQAAIVRVVIRPSSYLSSIA